MILSHLEQPLLAAGFRVPTALAAPLAVSGVVLLLLVILGKIPLSYNLRNLLVRWRITLLTALAFTLVIALQTVMLGFVAGMYQLTEESGQPGNVIVLSDGAIDELMSNIGTTESADIDRQPLVLRDSKGQPLASREVYVVVTQPVKRPDGSERRRFTQVRGLEDPVVAARVHNLELFEGGSWFSEAGVQPLPGADSGSGEQAIQAVLGEGVAGQFGADRGQQRLEVGDVFDLGPRKWIVVGIMKSSGSTFGSEVWAKRSLVGPMFGKPNFTTVVLRTANAKTASQLAADLTRNFKKSAVQAQTETAYFAKLSETNRQFLAAIIFVAIVMAVGGVFGVMNTMFAAISGRIKDIGVLRILGFRPLADPGFVLSRVAADRAGRRSPRLRARLPDQRLDRHQHRKRRAGGRRKIRRARTGDRRRYTVGRAAAGAGDGRSRRSAAGHFRHARPAAGIVAPATSVGKPYGPIRCHRAGSRRRGQCGTVPPGPARRPRAGHRPLFTRPRPGQLPRPDAAHPPGLFRASRLRAAGATRLRAVARIGNTLRPDPVPTGRTRASRAPRGRSAQRHSRKRPAARPGDRKPLAARRRQPLSWVRLSRRSRSRLRASRRLPAGRTLRSGARRPGATVRAPNCAAAKKCAPGGPTRRASRSKPTTPLTPRIGS